MLKVFTWIIDPKNRTIILFIIISLLVGLFFYQKNRTENFKNKYNDQVKETNRITNNYNASQDSLEMYIDKNGNLTGEISGYQITVEEWENQYDSLFSLYRIEKNKPPKTIIEYKTQIVENITEIPTQVFDSSITFTDTANYGNGNYRIISGKIPYNIIYRLKCDSVNVYAFNKALYYAFQLRERGIKDAFVVIYQNNKRVNYSEIKYLDSLIYRVQIYSSKNNIGKDFVSNKFNLDKKDIYKTYEGGIYKFMTGTFIPKENVEPIVPSDELYTFGHLLTGNADLNLKMGIKLGTALYKDPETQEIKIQVKSNYPGIIFQDIRGAEIMSTLKSNKKISRSFRKEFGVGLHLGFGGIPVANNDNWEMKWGPVISIGVNYTPRWLQFGANSGKNTISDLIY